MKNLLVAAFVAVISLSAAPGDLITCRDGRVVTENRTSPFQPDPCALPLEDAVSNPSEEALEFLMVFGPPPAPTQNSLRDRIARDKYAQDRRVFRGLVTPPDVWIGHLPALEASGLGVPVFYKNVYDEYVRFPDFPHGACEAPLEPATLSPGLVVARCQYSAVLRGACLPSLYPVIPGWISKINEENCSK
jgi:hypothetical protein